MPNVQPISANDAPSSPQRWNISSLLKWRLSLGTYFKIPLFVHWSFFLLPSMVWYQTYEQYGRWEIASLMVLMVLICFTCVILHEYGHALAASAFGIGTRDITMMPIGGVARLESMPRKPWQEITVAVAGPAVNVVIAATFAIALFAIHGRDMGLTQEGIQLAPMVLLINIGLIVFNMVPCFPMDGGRVFRAVMAMYTNYRKATWIAMRLGQVLAVGIAIYGVTNSSPFTPLIAAFVFVVGTMEYRQVDITERLKRRRVSEGMIRRIRVIARDWSFDDLVDIVANDAQKDFPVVEDGIYRGMIRGSEVFSAARRGLTAGDIKRLVRDVVPLHENEPLADALLSSGRSNNWIPVVDEHDAVVGLLDPVTCIRRLELRTGLEGQNFDSESPESDSSFANR